MRPSRGERLQKAHALFVSTFRFIAQVVVFDKAVLQMDSGDYHDAGADRGVKDLKPLVLDEVGEVQDPSRARGDGFERLPQEGQGHGVSEAAQSHG